MTLMTLDNDYYKNGNQQIKSGIFTVKFKHSVQWENVFAAAAKI